MFLFPTTAKEEMGKRPSLPSSSKRDRTKKKDKKIHYISLSGDCRVRRRKRGGKVISAFSPLRRLGDGPLEKPPGLLNSRRPRWGRLTWFSVDEEKKLAVGVLGGLRKKRKRGGGELHSTCGPRVVR